MKKWEYPHKCQTCGAWLYATKLRMVRLCSRCLKEGKHEGKDEKQDTAVR
jgi:hypothetical protein